MLTLTQLIKELKIIKKRIGKYPKKLYLDKEEFEKYVDILDWDLFKIWNYPNYNPEKYRKFMEKVRKEGKGIFFRNIPIERITEEKKKQNNP